MSLIEIYNNTDNTHRQEMFYEYLKKSGLKKSSYKQYAMTHPNNEAILTTVNDVAKKNSLFEVVDLLQVQNIYSKVKETDANKNVNNALSATVYNYKKFLDYLETEISSDDPENPNIEIDTLTIDEIKEKYRAYLKQLDGKYGGYVSAIEAQFVTDAVNNIHNVNSPYYLRNPKKVLSFVDYIRTTPALNEQDQALNNRRTSCSLKKICRVFGNVYKHKT